MLIIKSIDISNFRSIMSLQSPVVANDLNIIVGQNDIGKSNFLKALNLFFNGETELNTPFRFQDDFSKHAKVPNKKAPEVRIKIEFLTPSRFKNSEPIIWTKIWRREGFHTEYLHASSSKDLSPKGKGIQWVRKIKYKYVPAVRGIEYFNHLLGDLHDALSDIDPSTFQAVSSQFTKGLQKQVDELIRQIASQLGFKSEIGMPSNFKQLFSTLDFALEQNGIGISLNKKGDGIKAQHIPIILKFIANHYKKAGGKAVITPETIWGFEEPENNMEMGNAFKIAKIFSAFAKDLQIFINTHSPAFYSLGKHNSNTNIYLVKNDKGTQIGEISKENVGIFDIEMGILPIISEYVKKEVEARQNLERQVEEMSKLKSIAKFLVLSEDEDLAFVKMIFAMQGFDSRNTEFVTYRSRGNLLAAIQSCRIKLTDKPHLTDIIFHRDRDIYDGDEPDKILVTDRLASLNRDSAIKHHLFITEGYDIESYFINAEHINAIYPLLTIDEIEGLIDSATDECETISMDKLFGRIKIMQTEWVASGKQLNHFSMSGAIAEIKSLYNGNKSRYRYGKKVLGVLVGKLEKGRGRIDILRPSPFVAIKELRVIVEGKKAVKRK